MLITFTKQATGKAVRAQTARNRYAKQIAGMIGLGLSKSAISRATGLPRKQIARLLAKACPPFLTRPDPIRVSMNSRPRPPWTFPGPELLAIAHEARAEIEANLAARARR